MAELQARMDGHASAVAQLLSAGESRLRGEEDGAEAHQGAHGPWTTAVWNQCVAARGAEAQGTWAEQHDALAALYSAIGHDSDPATVLQHAGGKRGRQAVSVGM